MDVKLSDGPEAQGSRIAGVSARGLAERDGREQAPVRGTRRADQSQATREALIAAAHGLFAENGFAGVATEEIVRAAGVTRGALYHHFDGKRELFAAVYEDVERQLVERIAASAMASAGDPMEALQAGGGGSFGPPRGPPGARAPPAGRPSLVAPGR